MANELRITYTGASAPYAILRRTADGQVWNGSAFEAWSDANIANYDLPLGSLGGDLWAANFPAAVTDGVYDVLYYEYASGTTPSTTDLHLPADQTLIWSAGVASSGGSGGSGSGGGTMTVATARAWVRQFARDALDSSNYGNDDVDRAVQLVGSRFCRATRCLRQLSTTLLSANSPTVDLTTPLAAGFRPERLLDVYIAGQADPLSIVDYTTINAFQSDAARSAPPEGIAFPTPTTAQVYPSPDQAYVLTLRWWLPFTTWTPGGGDSTTLNLPDDYLMEILAYGAVATLQGNDPKHKFAADSWQKYLAFEQRLMGAGSISGKIIFRERRPD